MKQLQSLVADLQIGKFSIHAHALVAYSLGDFGEPLCAQSRRRLSVHPLNRDPDVFRA